MEKATVSLKELDPDCDDEGVGIAVADFEARALKRIRRVWLEP